MPKQLRPLLLLFLPIFWSCGNESTSSPDYPNFSDVYDKSIKGCSNLGCHEATATGDGVKSGPDLGSIEKAYAALVGKAASSYSDWKAADGACSKANLIVSGSATTSLAFAVVSEDAANGFAAATGISDCVPSFSIHSENNALISSTLDSFKKWINDGAKK